MASSGRAGLTQDRGETERALWRLVEAYHALVYYAPERPKVYGSLGVRGGWMGYFATRSAALGEVPPAVVTACFHGFAPKMVDRALPDAWRYTTPAAALAARLEVFDRAVRRHLDVGATRPILDVLADRLASIIGSLPVAGAPMFAAHRALPRPDEPHLALFWATTALREHRGDAHIAALRASAVDPVESNVAMVALGLVPPDQRLYRGWSEDEWHQAHDRLHDRGWLDSHGHITRRGQSERGAIEDLTDTLSGAAWAGLTNGELGELAAGLNRVTEPLITGGAVPYPNGMGMAPVPELTVTR